jgi:hypothetical protein
MSTKWIPKTNHIEGFAIFDESYFKNCMKYLAQGSTMSDFIDSIKELLQYLSCPYKKLDSYIDNMLQKIIKLTNRIPCPPMNETKNKINGKIQNEMNLYDPNVNPDTLSYINNIIHNVNWIINEKTAYNILYAYILTKESQEHTNGISDIFIIDIYNTTTNSFSDEQLEDFNARFMVALKSNVIKQSIMNFDTENKITVNTVGEIVDPDNLLNNLVSQIVSNIQNQISNVTDPDDMIILYEGVDYNGNDSYEVITNVNIIIKNHIDWVIDKTTAHNILYYYLNSKNSEESINGKFTPDKYAEFNNIFNESLYNQDVINMFISIRHQDLIEEPEYEEDDEFRKSMDKNMNGKLNSNICSSIPDADIKNDSKIIKNEIYNLLKIPLILFITYNIFYTFFYTNIYGNPEVYLKDIRTDFYTMCGFKNLNNFFGEMMLERSILGYYTNLASKPFQYFFNMIFKPIYNYGHSPLFFLNNSMKFFILLFVLIYLSIGTGGKRFFNIIYSALTFDKNMITKDPIYGMIYGLSFTIIMIFYLKWVFKFSLQITLPIIIVILYTIFRRFISLIIRGLVATASPEIATLIIFFYLAFYLIFAMKYMSIRGNIVDSIKEINKTLIDNNESKKNTLSVFLFNSIIEITALVIVLISIFKSASAIKSIKVHEWFVKINIILACILSFYVYKEFVMAFPFMDIIKRIRNMIMSIFNTKSDVPPVDSSSPSNTESSVSPPSISPITSLTTALQTSGLSNLPSNINNISGLPNLPSNNVITTK